MLENIKINPEFERLIPPLVDDEFELLKNNILSEQEIYTPIFIWDGFIIDGHHRFKILSENRDIKFRVVEKKFEFDDEYPDDKMIELSKRIKLIVDDKSKYTDWSTREDIKANLQVDLILLLDEFGYPPVTIDDVYKDVLAQAENFKKYA